MIEKVKQIELELTTRCNASCPQCARNFYGGKVWPTLPILDIDIDVVKKVLFDTKDTLTNVKLCGTYGDPCIYPNLIELVLWIREVIDCEITINTNGSIRSVKWWKELAKALGSKGRVFFGIDGLEDTHHLHRIGTDYKKIIKNLQSFNQAGGRSVWCYLIFKHNQHQIDQAKALSIELGCEEFAVKSTSRFLNKEHKLVDSVDVKNKQDQIIYWLRPTDDPRYINHGYLSLKNDLKKINSCQEYVDSTKISCRASNDGNISISAEGYALPCGWLLDRFYGYEAENHPDREKLFSFIKLTGGLEKIDIHKNNLYSIINGAMFQKIQESWNNNKLERCVMQCGSNSKLLDEANRELSKIFINKVTYKE